MNVLGTRRRHLEAVNQNTAARLALAATVAAMSAPPAAVLDDVGQLDAAHQAACDVYDTATADLDQARRLVADAARLLTEAEDRWTAAGDAMDQAARRFSAALRQHGLARTATGITAAGEADR